VGPALVHAQTSLDAPGAWAIGLICAAVAGTGYALFGLLARLVTPWTRGAAT
jgi:hypothetical protein